MLSLGQLITGTIEDLAFGGAGIMRHAGQVVFIPFTAPGDSVEAEITAIKPRFAQAQLKQVLNPGPDRIKPRCPYFGSCGGCQLQHLNYAAQLRYKQQSVQAVLTRLGGISQFEIEMHPATPHWHYRRHIHLQLRRKEGSGFVCGYIGVDNISLVQAATCPIFLEEQSVVLQQINELAAALPAGRIQTGRLAIFKTARGLLAHFHFGEALPIASQEIFKQFLGANREWCGIEVSSPGQSHLVGEESLLYETNGLVIEASSRAFLQNHPQQSALIYQTLLELTKNTSGKLLDTYCGLGATSILFSKNGWQVTGIEYNAQAVQLARRNAARNESQVNFLQGKTEDLLRRELLKQKPDLVLLNPPKTGLHKKVVQELCEFAPKQLLYISCQPATLARDVASLKEKYDIQSCQAFDMFPQTAHVETLLSLRAK